MEMEQKLQEILENIQEVLARDTSRGKELWAALSALPPVDIAYCLGLISRDQARKLFLDLPKKLRLDVFRHCSEAMKARCLSFLEDSERIELMRALTPEELTELFDTLPDDALKSYLGLLHKNVRNKVLSLLKFDPKSVGKIMDIDVLTFTITDTVGKSIKLLQRLQPNREIHQQIFVLDEEYRLQGHIRLEDLVLHKPETLISTFMRHNDLVVHPQDDREIVAKKMVHYGLMLIPVVDEHRHFLGIIPSDTLVDVLVEEASEDAQRMAALAPVKTSYFETPLWHLFSQRGYILVTLLLAESFSSRILTAHEAALAGLLSSFIPMLISTGGNMSNQTSAVAIQAMASGSVRFTDMWRFWRRELTISLGLMALLSTAAFLRVYAASGAVRESIIVAVTISCIVLLSSTLGSGIPFVLRKLNIDPAFSAGPFLATAMDILGVLIFCYISRFFAL